MKDVLRSPLGVESIVKHIRKKRARNRILVLMYHELSDDDAPLDSWTVVRSRDFVSQMEHLRRGYDVVSLDEALRRMSSTTGPAVPTAVVTFDDGYSGNAKVLLPIIMRLQFPVTIFVSTKAVEQGSVYWYDKVIMAVQNQPVDELDLTDLGLRLFRFSGKSCSTRWRGVQELLQSLKELRPRERETCVEGILRRLPRGKYPSRSTIKPLTRAEVHGLAQCPLVTIGAHSHCHNILVQLSPGEARESVERSRQLLEQWTGKSVHHFSYPNGDYNPEIMDMLAGMGFASGLTTEERWWNREDSPFGIPRFGIGQYDSMIQFRATTSGITR